METLEEIRRKLRNFEVEIEREPYILIKASDKVFISKRAKSLIEQKRIDEKRLISKITSEAEKCCKTNYEGLEATMMRLSMRTPATLAILRSKPCSPKNCILTKKELEVIRHLVKGLSNKEIASELGISPGTVNTHLDNIYRKLDVSNRLVASFKAIRQGIV